MPAETDYDNVRELQQRVAALEQENRQLRRGQSPAVAQHGHHPAKPVPRTVRKRSSRMVLGIPLWEIASGPDHEHGEERGHARAIFAVGDIADGVFAIGGIARGGICVGGVAMGLLTLGGVSLSLFAAMGGVAVAPFAFGGAAVGGVAIGGAAIGVYAKGDAASGLHTISKKEKDPEAVRFFNRWTP